MIETMSMGDDIDPYTNWELEGDGWFYRVRWEEQDFPAPANPRAYAVDIDWDTDGEDEEDLGLPSRVEIPFFVEDDEIADYLSDEYGYCVFGFNIEQN